VSWKKEVTKTLLLQKCEVSVQFTTVHNESVRDLWRSECDGEMKRISLQDGGTRTVHSSVVSWKTGKENE